MTGDLKMEEVLMYNSLGSGIIQGSGSNAVRWRMYQSGNGEYSLVLIITLGGSDYPRFHMDINLYKSLRF